MLTVQDIAAMPELRVAVAAGAGGLANEVTWLHVSELADPTPFLEGGEFLLTTGLGVGELATTQRAYVRRLAKHGLAGLGFGVGFGFAEVPDAAADEAEKLSFPILSVPYEVPFAAITKAAFRHLANEQLEQLTRALARSAPAEVVQPGDHVQVLVAGEVLVDRRVLTGEAHDEANLLRLAHDVESADRRAPRVWPQ